MIIAGDLVNKGPSSISVLRHCISKGILAVKGNHEASVLCIACGQKERKPKKHGWTLDLSPSDVTWLDSLPCTIRLPLSGALVVHAGLVPGRALSEHTVEEMTTMRDVVVCANGYVKPVHKTYKGGDGLAVKWAKLYKGEHGIVVFGHDAREGLQVRSEATS